MAVALAFAVGAALGSFLNVLIHRLPREESVVQPGSACPQCGATIAWRDNIPVLSYALLRGRCRACRGPISPQYPLVELAAGAILGVNLLLLGWGWEFVARSVFVLLLLPLAIIDGRHFLLPNELTFGGLILGVGLSAVGGTLPFREAVVGSIVGGGTLYLVGRLGTWAFRREAMGGGDVKMMAMMGAFLGWQGALMAIFLGSLAGTLIFGPMGLRGRKVVPFGVFLALGGGVMAYFPGALQAAYRALLL